MSDAYGRVKGGRLTFKGGSLASRSKTIDKKKKKKKKNIDVDNPEDYSSSNHNNNNNDDDNVEDNVSGDAGEVVYTIDAAKRMKYEELFPVEAKKFGYDPSITKSSSKSVEEVLDDRVKKKADRYCK